MAPKLSQPLAFLGDGKGNRPGTRAERSRGHQKHPGMVLFVASPAIIALGLVWWLVSPALAVLLLVGMVVGAAPSCS